MKLEFHQLEQRLGHLRVRRPERQRRLLTSLVASGQQVPIVVVAVENQPNRYQVIDGYKRIAALQQLGRDTVEATVWEMSEAEALVLDRSMRFSEAETALEQGWMLLELEQRFGYTLQDLAQRFDRGVSWVSRRLALVELLPESVQQKVRTGAISAHMAMKCLAPVARVSLDDCERMANGFAKHRFTVRQAGQLYAAWRDAAPGVRQRILEEPHLFLKAQEQAGPSASTAPPPMELMRDLEMVVAIARRADRRFVRAGPLMDQRQLEAARQQIERALEELEHLNQRIGNEQNHVEQTSAGGDPGTARPSHPQTADRQDSGNLPSERPESPALPVLRAARPEPSRESRALSPANPGAVRPVQGQPRAGP
jgi:ParB family chromosome partitioning protein